MALKKNTPQSKKASSLAETTLTGVGVGDLLLTHCKHLYSGNQQFGKWLSKVSKSITNADAALAFNSTAECVSAASANITEIFDVIKQTPRGKKLGSFTALLEEGLVSPVSEKKVGFKDLRLIINSQVILRFQLASYQAALVLSKLEGDSTVTDLLEKNTKSAEKQIAVLDELLAYTALPASNVASANIDEDKSEPVEAVYESINLTGKSTRK